jgi:hypothetical protein
MTTAKTPIAIIENRFGIDFRDVGRTDEASNLVGSPTALM